MSARLTALLDRLHALKPELRARFGVTGTAIFGSYARGEAGADSDLDLLLDFERTPTLFDLSRLDDFLEERLGLRVDTVPRESLNPRYARYIEPDIVTV